MNQEAPLSKARDIMLEFADATGLSAAAVPPRRYLWTDAYAVCTFLTLYRRTGDERFKLLALRLVEQVHSILGRHRDDDRRRGWISGLDNREGETHPTVGGLRIGKSLNERKPSDPFDERLEWDRDGQYYHYLTKWMHALHGVSRATEDPTYLVWAMELAKRAHAGFTYAPSPGTQKSMHWKMSIDLSYPLVPSMGQHDPLDGLVTYNQLQAAAARYSQESTWPDLKEEIADMAGICKGKSWATNDPLGIGGLLTDVFKVAQLIFREDLAQTDLLEVLLDAAFQGLRSYDRKGFLRLPVDYRLAFRELGLSIGLHALEKLRGLIDQDPGRFQVKALLHSLTERLMRYVGLGDEIEGFWLEGRNRGTGSWKTHRDINMVMLATSLAPDGYLVL